MADNSKKRTDLEQVFNHFDKDGSGKIDAAELKDAVREFYSTSGASPDEGQIDEDVAGILKACDTSKDNKIDKNEWFAFFKV
jgi:Ca2+-binding EF-hand superfamily protein